MESTTSSETMPEEISSCSDKPCDDDDSQKVVCDIKTESSAVQVGDFFGEMESTSPDVKGECCNTTTSINSHELPNPIAVDQSDPISRDSMPSAEIVDYGVSELPSPLKYLVPPLSISETSNEDNHIGSPLPTGTSQVLEDYRQQVEELQDKLKRVNKELSDTKDKYYSEIQALERALTSYNKSNKEKEEAFKSKIYQLQQEFNNKQKEVEVAIKEKDAMILKYASSESNVIKANSKCEAAERRLQEANKNCQTMAERVKIFQKERDNAVNQFDLKEQAIASLHKEVAKWKEEVNARETKLKWSNNKLSSEKERHKETEQKVENLVRKLEETRQELEQVRKDSQTTLRSFQESQENKALSLDHKLKEQQARLIIERHEREDKEESQRLLQNEVEALKCKQLLLITENNQLSVKVQSLEKERLEYEQKLSRLKQICDEQQETNANLQNQVSEKESLRIQLNHCEERLSSSQLEIERLRQSNVEFQQDMASCREREAELLEFTQKLTEKNVRLQSEFSATEAKAQFLEAEQGPLQRRLSELEAQVEDFKRSVTAERDDKQEQITLITKHLAERTHCAQMLSQQVEDLKAENEVLHRKHAAALRELNRELHQCRKKLDAAETGSLGNASLGQGSRTSSTSSLNTLGEGSAIPSQSQHNMPLTPQVISGTEPEKQVLVDRLIRLQRENARKAEKLDFLEEHSQQLLTELQKKTRIIQNYVMKVPTGALASDSMDHNKAESAKRPGIMGSMHGSKVDDTMTFELSMEINRKLQLVLEDTLLKNITLKESIDTLGSEIARLSKEKSKS